jgi:hypothetical protein
MESKLDTLLLASIFVVMCASLEFQVDLCQAYLFAQPL